MAKPLTLYSDNQSRVECGMHTFTGPLHVLLVMEWPSEEECATGCNPDEKMPRYFQVHCPQYQQPMIFNASPKNLKNYWNWQADNELATQARVAVEKLDTLAFVVEQLQYYFMNR